jgi:hypothetical protein
MSLTLLILIIIVACLLIYFVPKLDPPFRNIAICIIVVVLVLVLLSLLGVLPGTIRLR